MGKNTRKGSRNKAPHKRTPGAALSEPVAASSHSRVVSSASLQAKLDQLTQLALANDRAGFVSQFVPIELSPEDSDGYLADLTTAEEADGQWKNLESEIAALASGKGVRKIEGDQATNAVFFFEHPLLKGCDREVSFVCVEGEWRAEG